MISKATGQQLLSFPIDVHSVYGSMLSPKILDVPPQSEGNGVRVKACLTCSALSGVPLFATACFIILDHAYFAASRSPRLVIPRFSIANAELLTINLTVVGKAAPFELDANSCVT